MTARALRVAQTALAPLATLDLQPRHIGALVACDGMMVEVEGFPFPVGTSVRIATRSGRVGGEVIGFRGQRSLVQPFVADAGFATGARVEADGNGALVGVGDALLGRIIDAHGDPIDGGAPIQTRQQWPIAGIKANPLTRARVTRPIDVGVRAINGLLTIGEGQRVAIIAGSGVGKSVLMGQMLGGTDCDIIVIGMVGERAREVSDFIETKLTDAIRPRTVVVAVAADHPPLLRLRAAARATAIAESFRARGARVLLMIDSLTRVAHAQREIGLSLGEPPTMKGYPPSALGLIPRLVERAGNDRASSGAITAIYTVLADGGDVDDPIVDAARAIVDGHIILSRSLAESGVFPAIDIARSLSRTMADVIDPAHAAAAARFRQLWSAYEDNRDLVMMGAYAPGADGVLDAAMAQRGAMLGYVQQAAGSQVTFDAARAALIDEFGA